MSHCVQYQINGYRGGFDPEKLAEMSYVRSNSLQTAFLSKLPHSTSFKASEYLAEILSDYIMGSATRFYDVNSLFNNLAIRFSQSEVVPVWLAAVNNRDSAIDMDGIALTIRSISEEIANQNFTEIDFSRINRESPNPQHLVALLRTTYPFRDKILGWSDLRDFSRAFLSKKGYSTESVMRGL